MQALAADFSGYAEASAAVFFLKSEFKQLVWNSVFHNGS
jgi:hypothetical protein